MRLASRVAVVTGVTSPIGQAIALRLAAEGAAVAVTGHTPAKLEPVVEALRAAKARCFAEALDLSVPETVERFFAQVDARLGPTDILVNGTAWRARQSFLETTYADWRKTFAGCVDSYFYCSLAAARRMVPRKWGRIIHIGSIAASVMMVPFTAYTSAKAAVHGLATAMAVDLAPHGITVNVVAPGVVESRYVRENLSPEQIQKRLDRIPAGKLASPEDCAAAVAHLASPDMGYVTGQVVHVDGGFLSAGVIAR
ncbi:MAG TPA: SDR family oxidoreductase [Candidatus Methylomirabilis sp.]|nr:SDR family oxidoreductase [Candidatus Methylomirabilis sp.]HSC72395.1 SDR family oxidoreductase [Candidatus Methylomirabilis sp.]